MIIFLHSIRYSRNNRNEIITLMFKTLIKVNFLFLASLFLFSCNSKPPQEIGKENPFAVMAKKYRNPTEAILAKEILENKGLKPYLACFDQENEGLWHGVFLGSYPTLESMMKGKIDYEDKFGLRQIERINFHQLKNSILAYDYQQTAKFSIQENLSQLDSNVVHLLKQLPHQAHQRLLDFKLIHQMDGNCLRAQAVSKYTIDFPRGLSATKLLKNAATVIEANLINDFSEQAFNIQAIQLIADHAFGNELAKTFSDQILDTREYDFETSEAFSAGKRSGYTVSLSPRQDRIRNYIILFDAAENIIYFLQSREKFYPLAQLKKICDQIGKSSGFIQYPNLNRTLAAIPNQSDSLVALTYERLQIPKGKSANRWTGNDKSTYFFYTTAAGFWNSELTNVPSKKNVQDLYNQSVLNYKFRSKKTALEVANNKAILLSIRRRKQNGRGSTTYPETLYFMRGNTLGKVTNRGKAWLTQAQLEEKAMSFNLR
ncbi:MAG: hypothetical protein ACPGJS_10105 [Flammeovirgaceae bacterium]